jgi:hypothetical protein
MSYSETKPVQNIILGQPIVVKYSDEEMRGARMNGQSYYLLEILPGPQYKMTGLNSCNANDIQRTEDGEIDFDILNYNPLKPHGLARHAQFVPCDPQPNSGGRHKKRKTIRKKNKSRRKRRKYKSIRRK